MKGTIYDNGEKVLGVVYDVKDYILRNSEEAWESEDLINRLEDLDEDDIVVINYDGLCWTIDYWKKSSLIDVKEDLWEK